MAINEQQNCNERFVIKESVQLRIHEGDSPIESISRSVETLQNRWNEYDNNRRVG